MIRTRSHDANLVREAAAELDRLRRENERLCQYHYHTERMLALFEGGPQVGAGLVTGGANGVLGGVDALVHQMNTLAKALEVEESLDEKEEPNPNSAMGMGVSV